MEKLESKSPPLAFLPKGRDLLTGIKILDITRAIAGPIITRTLAEYGADVLHICHRNVPEVPYDPIAFNVGKKSCDLNLKDPKDRATFETLLDEADILVDGYRPGVLDRLGYGKAALVKRFGKREKGFIYVAENCYGFGGPLSHRSGWQQIADCVTGLSWEQGRALGRDEPIDPPLAVRYRTPRSYSLQRCRWLTMDVEL
jgi:crotonobetainyl-CoA:carnitine CoA-transferase CaiB-like acyl-CoA transferase